MVWAVVLAGCASRQLDDGMPSDITCTSCHGSGENAAPPVAINDESETTDLAVGAHRAHLAGGRVRNGIACEECHAVPATATEEGHIDPLPAELTWGKLAAAGGAAPVWDRDFATCSSVYCHGATLGGGSNTKPSWTVVDGTQAACGTCHGAPPPEPHPQMKRCDICHPATVLDDGALDLAGGHHIDGAVDVEIGDCSSCHGSSLNPAPPVSVSGQSSVTDGAVGAHQAHLNAGPMRQAVACDECHVVPASALDGGHLGELPAEITWGALATADGAAPFFDGKSASCSSTYCHGATMSGGNAKSPVWTSQDPSITACGACHGAPPPGPHPQVDQCALCHPGTVLEDGGIDVYGGLHIDGQVEVAGMGCSSCHGSEENAAPPTSVGGAEATTVTEVGAHQSHVKDGPVHLAMGCPECHVVPADVSAAGHMDDAPAEVTWGALAQSGGAKPSWARDSGTCSSTYCHGGTLGGGSNTKPSWTVVDGTQAACGTCHGNPPPAPPHPNMGNCHSCHVQLGTDCAICHIEGPEPIEPPDHCHLCHAGTVMPDGQIDVAGGLHVDGTLQYSVGFCGGCHGVPPDTGSHKVHFDASPNSATYGGTGATAAVSPDVNGYAFDCGSCHPIDPSHHANGLGGVGGSTAEVDLSPVGAAPGTLKSMNAPNAHYEPGPVAGVDPDGFAYTSGTCSGVYCHSFVEWSSQKPIPVPGEDFPFDWEYPIEYPDFEVASARVFGSAQWGNSLSCDGCHAFPPRTTSAEVDAGVGDSHSWIDDQGQESLHGWNHGFGPLPCTTCHAKTVIEPGVQAYSETGDGWAVYQPVPIHGFVFHVNGTADVAFTAGEVTLVSGKDLSSAQYDPATRTCSSVECHKSEAVVAWGSPYRWWLPAECNKCHQY